MSNDETKNEKLSKTQEKKLAQDVLARAKSTILLTEKQLIDLELPEEIRLEVLKAQKIKSRSARLRQTKYIAKLMRSLT